MVKVTLEFTSVDVAIVALGKLAGAPVKANIPVAAAVVSVGAESTAAPVASATKPARRGRSDKGQARGPNAATLGANAAPDAVPAVADTAGAGTQTAPSNVGEKPATLTATPPAPAPASGTTPQQATEAVFNKHGAQIAMNMLARFGVKRVRDMKIEQHAEFVTFAAKVLETGSVDA